MGLRPLERFAKAGANLDSMNSATGQELRSINIGERIAAFEQLGRLFALLGSKAKWPGHACGLNDAEFTAFEIGRASCRERVYSSV